MTRSKRSGFYCTVFASLLTGLAIGAYAQRRGWLAQGRRPAADYTFFDPLIDIRHQIRRNYVVKVSDKKLLRGAIRGMMSQLDPYSTYFSPRQWKLFDQETHGTFSGIGAKMAQHGRNGPIVVISPLENSPALRAGMLAGDNVLAINGRPVGRAGLRKLENLLSGPPGSTVHITVLHRGSREPVVLTIHRRILTIRSVKGFRRRKNGHWDYWLNHRRRIAYVRISAFMSGTAGELDKALLPLFHSNGGVKGLVLDLRFNPGGLLTSAVAVADRFLSAGVIVTTHGRNKQSDFVARATPAFNYPHVPLVVLVNQYSASAAEIVAGAIKDHHRGLLIGTRTFGKGSVQNLITLHGGRSAIKLTTAYYYLPSGRNIMRKKGSKLWGVDPDPGFTIPMTNAQNRALLQARAESDIVLPKGQKPATAAQQTQWANQHDPQLQRALQTLVAQQLFSGTEPLHVTTTQPTVSASIPPAAALPPAATVPPDAATAPAKGKPPRKPQSPPPPKKK